MQNDSGNLKEQPQPADAKITNVHKNPISKRDNCKSGVREHTFVVIPVILALAAIMFAGAAGTYNTSAGEGDTAAEQKAAVEDVLSVNATTQRPSFTDADVLQRRARNTADSVYAATHIEDAVSMAPIDAVAADLTMTEDTNGADTKLTDATGENNETASIALTDSDDTLKEIEQDKLVYVGNVTLRNNNVSETYRQLKKDFQKKYEAAFTDESRTTSGGEYYNTEEITASIRVPVEHYNELMDALEDYGDITSLSSQAQNISDQYNSLDERTKSLDKEIDRLNDLIKEAKDAAAIADLNDQLNYVQAELDLDKSELARMNQGIAYSYVYLTIKQEAKSAEEYHGFAGQLRYAAETGGRFFARAGQWLLLGIAWLWPLILVILGIALIVKAVKKGKNRKAETAVKPVYTEAKRSPANKTVTINADGNDDGIGTEVLGFKYKNDAEKKTDSSARSTAEEHKPDENAKEN